MKKIVILGAGIAGLAAAWYVQKKTQGQVDLMLIEKSDRIGGWIQTLHEQGFLFEEGPRGFRPSGKGKATLELVKELGLEKELVSSNLHARKRYLYLDGKLQTFNMWFLLKQGLLGAAFHDWFTLPSAAEDESIASFVERRFNQRLSENLMDPLIKGIFGGDCRKLSIRSCLPFLWNFEKKEGSVVRGLLHRKKKDKPPASLYTFKGGMETLPLTLAQQLNGSLILSKTVTDLKDLEADYVISTLPASELAKLLGYEDPIEEYATLSTIHCGWNKRVLKKRGYGFLIPSKEESDILGMTWDSEIFPELNQNYQTRLCIMVGGGHTHDDLRSLALNSLQYYLGIVQPPDVCIPFVAKNAIPQYTLNYFRRLAAFKKKMPSNLYALGQSFEGVGINECIFNAKVLIENLSI